MVSRAVWKGALRVGDFACPVSLITAVSSSDRIAFQTVNRATGHRLNRQFVDAETGELVSREDQVKGYDTGEGGTIILEADEITSTLPTSDKTLAVQSFVPVHSIDDVFLDRPYYLVPSDEAATAVFAAIREGLATSNVAALAQAVLFRRQRTVMVRATDDGMIATLLSYDYQVRRPKDAFGAVPTIKIEREMLNLAEHIIKTKMGSFDPKLFDDRYENAVAEMVRAKIDGKPLKAHVATPQRKVVDLMEALRASAKGGGDEAAAGPSRGRESTRGQSGSNGKSRSSKTQSAPTRKAS